MTAPISTPPWDLAAGNRWTIQSEDHRIANDRGNETVVDAQGNVVAYVSGNNDEGGNGALLAHAPLMAEVLRQLIERHDRNASETEAGFRCGCLDCQSATAALKQAGAL